MSKNLARISIKNLRLRTYIGFNQSEKENKQDVVINAHIYYGADRAVTTDNVQDAVNYKTITKRIIRHVEDGRFLLLEKLTQDVIDICRDHPWIEQVEVEVDKPHALRFADSVSLCLSWQK
ncbi:dihydroneopterin triphosphate 2'-epimerase [Saccharobesus litoralis]|uniref:Dihydroneopterin triphosphate 2'-epimerase n=1 Tax=Saccharobesus litoralis TaxID=2172099 RepID=A0A2S0VXY3_9ALTE|nr:dihydroneopterin triphosphate 2'-epimerase [Saccharobesus litoralis]AWB69071.1 dihydroneopterin triphosphate 2'-epimerase [Saccharobesus litoralis]